MISGRLLAAYRGVVGSYAFLPALLIAAGVALAVLLAVLDKTYGTEWIGPFAKVLGPVTGGGARSILSTIGGSMLSVAGIVFSVTLAAIVFASGQYGPHVLPQYRRDRLAQVTLGVMLGVFAYCMTALYVVQEGREDFVPRLAVFGALVLAALGVGMLISFISHMLTLLHVSTLIGRIGSQAGRLIALDLPVAEEGDEPPARLAPKGVGHDAPWLTSEGDPLLRADGKGYVLTVGTDKLVALAEQNGMAIDLLVRPGDYVTPLTPILRASRRPDEEVEAKLRRAFAYGRRRTLDEDAAFTLDELCAIGLRALSPGVNDPFTATDVMNQLAGVVERAARGKPLDAIHRDEAGVPRVRRPVLTFDDVVRLSFDRMATDASSNVTLVPVIIALYDTLLTNLPEGPERDRLREAFSRFRGLCATELPTDEARGHAERACARVLGHARRDDLKRTVRPIGEAAMTT